MSLQVSSLSKTSITEILPAGCTLGRSIVVGTCMGGWQMAILRGMIYAQAIQT